ncbi:MAG: peptidoglycan DD-metalloendopeptidase family protein [Clostridiales Family XIII bacterium]|jgi:murein DD-endopeptidase MepM/ murein hydrolase activator NlpD|nr:peptidoglycan DD-metalloendopeptidase family protein [Clostridiales Family XIII bacterium]
MCVAAALALALSFLLACPMAFAEEATDAESASEAESSSGSSSTQDLANSLETVRSNLQAAQSDYDSAVARLKELESTIAGLKTQIAEQEAAIAEQEAEIAEYDAQIATKKEEIAQMEAEIKDQNSDLNQRLRVMYETGDESMLVVLLGSENIVDFMANIDMIKAIHQSDQELLEQMEKMLNDLEAAKAELEQIEAMLVSEKEEMEAQKATLEANKAQQAAAAAEVQSIRDAALEDIEALEAESKKIQAELAARQSTWEYGGGAMSWPVQGTVTSEYGMRTNPVTGRYVLHAGIDIGVGYGTPVHAATDGVVTKAQWYGGYGNAVIIEHGSGIYTLYGHNSSLLVSVGQAVSRGDVIALAGSTGNSTGPHVHFEVIVNGSPQNPRGWL